NGSYYGKADFWRPSPVPWPGCPIGLEPVARHPRIRGASFVGAGLKPAPTAHGCHHYGRPPDENVRRAGASSPRAFIAQVLLRRSPSGRRAKQPTSPSPSICARKQVARENWSGGAHHESTRFFAVVFGRCIRPWDAGRFVRAIVQAGAAHR